MLDLAATSGSRSLPSQQLGLLHPVGTPLEEGRVALSKIWYITIWAPFQWCRWVQDIAFPQSVKCCQISLSSHCMGQWNSALEANLVAAIFAGARDCSVRDHGRPHCGPLNRVTWPCFQACLQEWFAPVLPTKVLSLFKRAEFALFRGTEMCMNWNLPAGTLQPADRACSLPGACLKAQSYSCL